MRIVFSKKVLCLLVFFALSAGCGSAKKRGETIGKAISNSQSSKKTVNPQEDKLNLERYFDRPEYLEATLALDEDRLQDALRLFDQIAQSTQDKTLGPRARFLGAYISGLIGDYRRALNELPGLAAELPIISDTIYECAARSALALGDFEKALELALKVDENVAGFGEIAMIIGDALSNLNRDDEALLAYRRFLDRQKNNPRRIEARAKVISLRVKSLEKKTDADDSTKQEATEILGIIDQLRTEAPADKWVESLDAQETTLFKLIGQQPAQPRTELKDALSAYEKAQELMAKRSFDKAENALARVIKLARKNGSLSCLAKYDLALTVSNKRDHARAAMLFSKAADVCSASDVRVKALYRAGKSYFSAGRLDDAIGCFTQIENDYPTHSYADDARLNTARCQLEKGDKESFTELLESLPSIYPMGDMRQEALWRLASDALFAEDFVRAQALLEKYYNLFPTESGWYEAGRSGYWLARCEQLLGNIQSSIAHYEHVISTAPLSFYMLLAYNRLEEIDKVQADKLMSKLAPLDKDTGVFEPSVSLLTEHHGLPSALELYRLGLTTRLKRAFDDVLEKPDLRPEVYWLVSTLLRRAGRYSDAALATEKEGSGWKRRYPVGRDHTQWAMAYPVAYEEDVRREALENGITPFLIWAVMREESGFNPKVESSANAVGLMQLIVPTAKRIGKKKGIYVTKAMLRDPKINIKLGATYLSRLKEMFKGHPALMVAAYNAGEGAVARWIEEEGHSDIDFFIEQIPYDQTRGYTKRVLAGLAAYSLLYGDGRQLLTLDLSVPRNE